jgi:hypothetical protein
LIVFRVNHLGWKTGGYFNLLDLAAAPKKGGDMNRKNKILAWSGGTFAGLLIIGGIANAVGPVRPHRSRQW